MTNAATRKLGTPRTEFCVECAPAKACNGGMSKTHTTAAPNRTRHETVDSAWRTALPLKRERNAYTGYVALLAFVALLTIAAVVFG